MKFNVEKKQEIRFLFPEKKRFVFLLVSSSLNDVASRFVRGDARRFVLSLLMRSRVTMPIVTSWKKKRFVEQRKTLAFRFTFDFLNEINNRKSKTNNDQTWRKIIVEDFSLYSKRRGFERRRARRARRAARARRFSFETETNSVANDFLHGFQRNIGICLCFEVKNVFWTERIASAILQVKKTIRFESFSFFFEFGLTSSSQRRRKNSTRLSSMSWRVKLIVPLSCSTIRSDWSTQLNSFQCKEKHFLRWKQSEGKNNFGVNQNFIEYSFLAAERFAQTISKNWLESSSTSLFVKLNS